MSNAYARLAVPTGNGRGPVRERSLEFPGCGQIRLAHGIEGHVKRVHRTFPAARWPLVRGCAIVDGFKAVPACSPAQINLGPPTAGEFSTRMRRAKTYGGALVEARNAAVPRAVNNVFSSNHAYTL